MTLKQIHAMFAEGQTWEADNTYNVKASGPRTLTKKGTTQYRWSTPQAPTSFMYFPRATEILEASDGLLRFKIFPEQEHTLTLRRTSAG